MTDETAAPQADTTTQATAAEPTRETLVQHVHDELAKLIHAIESGAHNGLEHLKALKETVAKHLP